MRCKVSATVRIPASTTPGNMFNSWTLLALAALVCVARAEIVAPEKQIVSNVKDAKVQLELFVMSKCPDAQRCEARMDEVLKKVHAITSVKTRYIADGTFPSLKCKHGAMECEGNKQQLCAHKYAHESGNYNLFWQFLMCQDSNPSKMGNATVAQDCLTKVGYDAPTASRVLECAAGYEGDGLLAASVGITNSRGVKKSCTIYIDAVYRCTHDGGKWYDCPGGSEASDFISSICVAYQNLTGEAADVCS